MSRKRAKLTPTMIKILARHASGLTFKEVAREVYISYSAVTNMMNEARSRTGAGTNAALVMYAHDLGYLSHPTGPDRQVFPLQPTDLET